MANPDHNATAVLNTEQLLSLYTRKAITLGGDASGVFTSGMVQLTGGNQAFGVLDQAIQFQPSAARHLEDHIPALKQLIPPDFSKVERGPARVKLMTVFLREARDRLGSDQHTVPVLTVDTSRLTSFERMFRDGRCPLIPAG